MGDLKNYPTQLVHFSCCGKKERKSVLLSLLSLDDGEGIKQSLWNR